MIDYLRSLRPLALAAGTALVLAAPLRAQEIAPAAAPVPVAAEAAPAPAGPTLSSATVAVRRAPVEATPPAAPAAGRGQDRATALMIVGGAAILTGIVIGNGAGYAISVGGAVIGLYGLYLYLQ